MSSVHQVFLAVIRRFLKANFKKSIVLSYDMQSVLIGSEYPVMDTLLFYVKNGEKLELSIIIRSRTHSSLTLCSVSKSM